MTEKECIEQTTAFVKDKLQGAEAGHDWFHIERVCNISLEIARTENVDVFVVHLGALLHDIADAKFHGGDEEVGPKTASDFLTSLSVDKRIIEEVVKIIRHISFKNSFAVSDSFVPSQELKVVQDADRLDAIGAIGIARAFNFGGYKNRPMYDPDIEPRLNMTKAEYKKSANPTINHFYEKLLLLKDRMNTDSGKKLAIKRHEFMLNYLDQFHREWQGKA